MTFSQVKIGEVFTMQNTGLRGEVHDVNCLKTTENSYFVIEYNKLVKSDEPHKDIPSLKVLFKNMYHAINIATIAIQKT